jgi:hypothetical protein
MERSKGGTGSRQCQAFDERHSLRLGPSRSAVTARLSVERGEAAIAVQVMPALKCSRADPGFSGEGGEGNLVFDMQPKNPPPPLTVHDRYIVAACEA